MHIPAWKKYLSYLWEIHIESASSEINPHLYVSLKRGRLQLCTANAVYSYGDLYDNFSKAFDRINLDRLPGDEVLLLGFGLGSIPVILEKSMGRSYYYTAIEIDEAVIDLANRYVLDDLDSPIQMIRADAYAFAVQTEATFDLICMDVFEDDKIPEEYEELEFLEQLRDLLNPGALLLYNRLAVHRSDIEQSRLFFEQKFKKVFPNATYLDVEGNWMLMNDAAWLS